MTDDRVRKNLELAIEKYEAGDYEKALELDQVLPRIKVGYQQALREVAEEMKVPLIDIQAEIPRTDKTFPLTTHKG